MTRHLLAVPLLLLLVASYVPLTLAQASGTVKGVCKDTNGQPIVDATVTYVSLETGHKYTLKTNKKGEFFSLGVAPGKYTVTLSKNNQELFHFNNVSVTLDEEGNVLNFDLQKEQAQGAGLTPEQIKQQQAEKEKIAKENANVKSLNDQLAASRAAMQAGNYEQAIQSMTGAAQLDPNRDLIWFTLGEAYAGQAKKTAATDRSAAKSQYQQAVDAYQKAIAIKPMADYYNNLAQAQAGAGQIDEAIKSYQQAAQIDPTRAATFDFNIGAVETNAGRIDEAIESFKKVISLDPSKAEAYYQLGINLLGKATLQGDKTIAPEGTAEAFNKYLQLAPNGPYAETAKAMLAQIGATVETSYGKKKTKTK